MTQVLSASILGRDHLSREANSQDALAIQLGFSSNARPFAVAAISDGCGSSPFSELGARLLVQGVTHRAAQRLSHGASAESLVPDLLDHATRLLESVTHHALASHLDHRDEFVRSHLLATLSFVVDDGVHVAIVAQGDGLIAIDDQVHVLECANTPPYLAYKRLGVKVAPTFVSVRPSVEITRIALSTDGLPAHLVPQLWGHQGRSLQRWLNVRALREPLLDDTSVVVLERVASSLDSIRSERPSS
jgi:hypothetical protein